MHFVPDSQAAEDLGARLRSRARVQRLAAKRYSAFRLGKPPSLMVQNLLFAILVAILRGYRDTSLEFSDTPLHNPFALASTTCSKANEPTWKRLLRLLGSMPRIERC